MLPNQGGELIGTFLHENAALSPVLQPFPTPGDSPLAGLHYYKIYRTRQADLTNFPKKSNELVASAAWSSSDRFSLSTHFRANGYQLSEMNDFSGWSKTLVAPSVVLWVAPSEKADLMAELRLAQPQDRVDVWYRGL